MDRKDNPYAPGAGLQPPELAGRDQLIQSAQKDMERILAGRSTRGLMLLGLRGVGKTVLLNRLRDIAKAKGLQTIKVEAPEGGHLPQLLAVPLREALYEMDAKAAASQAIQRAMGVLRNFVSSFNVKIGDIELSIPVKGKADSKNLAQDLPDLILALAESAQEQKTGIALFVDEMQYLSSEELASLIFACHETAQRSLPLFFVGAGLPQIAALSGQAKSYSERLFDFHEINKLNREAAQIALTNPARAANVEFTSDAVSEILHVTECYPYFIQEWGFRVWDSAEASPIQLDDVKRATPIIIAHLDKSFFRVRFDRLTPLQQKYLRGMAELGSGPYQTGEIAAALGARASSFGVTRQSLINSGMVWSQRHGETAFTVPMFDAFMKRQMPGLLKHRPKARGKTKKKKRLKD